MKKMYKKPITEASPMEPAFVICALSEGGNTSEIGGGEPEGNAPKRRDVF